MKSPPRHVHENHLKLKSHSWKNDIIPIYFAEIIFTSHHFRPHPGTLIKNSNRIIIPQRKSRHVPQFRRTKMERLTPASYE